MGLQLLPLGRLFQSNRSLTVRKNFLIFSLGMGECGLFFVLQNLVSCIPLISFKMAQRNKYIKKYPYKGTFTVHQWLYHYSVYRSLQRQQLCSKNLDPD